VTFGGTAGVTGTSGTFTSGVLNNASVTPTVAGSSLTVTVTDGSSHNGSTTIATVNPGALDHFAISAISSPQTAGTAITGITLTAQDVNINTLNTGPNAFSGTVTYSGTAGITGTSANFSSGVLSGVSVTPTVAGSSKTFIVTGSSKTGTSTFNVNPGAVTAAQSTVSASPTPVVADGSTTSTITVTLKDANSNPVSGKTVTLASSRGATDAISAASGSSSSSGVVTFTVKSTAAGSPVFTATDSSDSVTVTQTATVTFTVAPPVANPATYSRAKGTAIKISITNLIAQSTSDLQDDAVGLVSVAGGLLTNNTVIATTTNGSTIFYTPSFQGSAYIIVTPTNNLSETFAYVVNDTAYPALTATNVITINVTNAVGQVTGSISTTGGGGVTTTWAAIPGSGYAVQRSPDLSTWTDIWTTNAPTAGVFTFTDSSPPQPTAYYRLRQN
jgi:hypothetical protein